MSTISKSYSPWLHIERRFYLGLYKRFKNPKDMEKYYRVLHESITWRGEREQRDKKEEGP